MGVGTRHERTPGVRLVLGVWLGVALAMLLAGVIAHRYDGHGVLAAWFDWPFVLLLMAGAAQCDWAFQRRQGRGLPLGAAVADALLAVTSVAALLLLTSQSLLAVVGALLVLVVLLEWLARRRTWQGHWDGPLLLTAVSGVVTYFSAQRPWAPSSGQWPFVTAVAAAVAALSATSLMQVLRGCQ